MSYWLGFFRRIPSTDFVPHIYCLLVGLLQTERVPFRTLWPGPDRSLGTGEKHIHISLPPHTESPRA